MLSVEFISEKEVEKIGRIEEEGEVVYCDPDESGKEVIVKGNEVIIVSEWFDGWIIMRVR